MMAFGSLSPDPLRESRKITLRGFNHFPSLPRASLRIAVPRSLKPSIPDAERQKQISISLSNMP
jgi:hypothetical protein